MDEFGHDIPEEAKNFVAPGSEVSTTASTEPMALDKEKAERQLYETWQYIDEVVPTVIEQIDKKIKEGGLQIAQRESEIFDVTEELLKNNPIALDSRLQNLANERITERIQNLLPAVQLLETKHKIQPYSTNEITHLTPALANKLISRLDRRQEYGEYVGHFTPSLNLSGLKELDEPTARALIKWPGGVKLRGEPENLFKSLKSLI